MSRPRPPVLHRSSLAVAIACAPLFVAPLACDGESAPPREPFPAIDPSADVGAAAPDPSAEASASTGSAPAAAALAGTWEGSYEAKKGHVGMPAGVPDPARKADDGKDSTGPGAVTLTITAAGDVTGKSQGALGSATIRGKIDGKMLRASFVPDDPLAPKAMTGVLVGIIKGEVIQTEVRVAGPDALLVRQANFDLKKKP